MSDEEILEAYNSGELFYIGSIPLSLRDDDLKVELSNALSTFVCYLNENAEINGEKLFANPDVRKALSLAIDRDAIVNAIVYAEAATGLVCPGVLNAGTTKKKTDDFRTVGGELIASSAKVTDAQKLLDDAEINPSKYSFEIKVAGYDDVNVKIVEMIAEAWRALEFDVEVKKVYAIQNNDIAKELADNDDENNKHKDIADDAFIETIQRGTYEVIAFDYNAYSADAWSMLSSFATPFSGMHLIEEKDENNEPIYSLTPHSTGYNSEAYNNLMEAVYYIPYFASFTDEQLADDTFTFLSIYDTHEEFMEIYNTVKAIYAEYGITPTTDDGKWTAQKATLLHKAEEMLLEDMPVIPVVFTKNAVMMSDDLSKVSASYYVPAIFYKAQLKDYEKYTEKFSTFPDFNKAPETEEDDAE